MKNAWTIVLVLVAALLLTGASMHALAAHAPSVDQSQRGPEAVVRSQAAEPMFGRQDQAAGRTASAIERDPEPVVVTGAHLPRLVGTPTDSLFVYAYRDGDLVQIPFQVDEVASGAYTNTIGNPFDADDEIAFMASDLGGLLPDDEIIEELPISLSWYQVEVSDLLSPTARGWAYVVRSNSLTKTFTETYVSFDPSTKRITTTAYALGYPVDYPGFDYLALNHNAQNILDRTKIRLEISGGKYDEENIAAYVDMGPITPTRDGPVRVILPKRGMMAYRSLVSTSMSQTLDITPTFARFSTDFNVNATGATFYNQAVPLGVTIDGVTDTVPAEPLSPWYQVTHDTGTIVQVGDSSGMGGTQTNYYKDNATLDTLDTGDQRSYGDVGVQIDSPEPIFSYYTRLYFLPPQMGNVAETYVGYFQNPLQVTTTPSLPYGTYLPLVVRD